MQRKSSKASPPTLKSYKGRNRNPESSMLTNNSLYSSNYSTEKQHKSQIKRRYHKTSSNITINDEKLTGSSRLSVDEWLQKDMQSYKLFKSSGVEGIQFIFNVIQRTHFLYKNKGPK